MASSALIDDLLKQFAENPRRVFARLANEYRKRGELDTAIEICRAHVPLQPTYISGYIVLGQALYETGQLDEARSTFETALGLDPENLIGLRQLGDIARAKGDASGARGWYRRLLEVDPQNDEVEALLREIEAPAASAPAPQAAHEGVSWNDINPEHSAPAGQAPAAPAVPPASAEPPAKKTLDFDYDVLSSFGETESLPALEHPEPTDAAHADTPASKAAEPAPQAVPAAPATPSRPVVEASHDEPLPAAFITETMAELYLQQGHREQALDIYRLLLAQRPGDVSLLNRIARLEQPAPAAPLERTVRAFFGRFANRRPPGVRTETDLTPISVPSVSATAGDEPPPLGAALEPAVPAPGAESEPAPLPEPMALETAESWLPADSPPAHTPAPADAHEPPAFEPAAFESAPTVDEPSIADFAPSAPEPPASEPAAEPMPEPVAQAEPVAAPPEPNAVGERAFASDRVLSFADLFVGRGTSAADEQAATTLAGAYGTDAGMPDGGGHATRAASDALSLDDVFGGGVHEHESVPVTFDEFFSSREGGAQPDAAPERATEPGSTPPVAARRADDADLELFHQWLEGLKK